MAAMNTNFIQSKVNQTKNCENFTYQEIYTAIHDHTSGHLHTIANIVTPTFYATLYALSYNRKFLLFFVYLRINTLSPPPHHVEQIHLTLPMNKGFVIMAKALFYLRMYSVTNK